MKVTYDPTVDALRIRLSDAVVKESDEEKPGVILDFDEAGHLGPVAADDEDAHVRSARPPPPAATWTRTV